MYSNPKIDNKIIENIDDSLRTIAIKLGVNTYFYSYFNATSNKINIISVSKKIQMNPIVFNKLQLSFKTSPIIIKHKDNGIDNIEIKGKLNWLYETFEGNYNHAIATTVKINMTVHIMDDDKFCIGVKTKTTNKFIDTIDINDI